MAIGCVYCDGEHDTAAEVRQCWERNGQVADGAAGADATPDTETGSSQRFDEWSGDSCDVDNRDFDSRDVYDAVAAPSLDADVARPVARPTMPRVDPLVIRPGVARANAGPDALARNAVVAPAGDVPAPWQQADRVVVDEATLRHPTEAINRLRRNATNGQRVIIELSADFDQPPASAVTVPPHELHPSFSFELDDLHHLVWSNSVDHREPEQPTWVGLDAAIAAGASAVDDGTADIVLPTGEKAWIDGGPFRHTDPIDGIAVVPFVSIEHRSLSAPGPNVADADLAPDQLAAVTHEGGSARIIAPAGSGKTRVLTERARHLLTNWNVPPSAVSLVAFNKRAQEEMAERTADLPTLGIRTLNAIGLAIVNGTPPFAPQPKRWNTINEPEVRRIIGNLVSFPRRRNADPVAPWIEALSVIRLGLVDPADAEARYDGDVDGLAEMWPRYRDALTRAGAVDFDDQIYRALDVLLTQPAARAAAQRACRVMLVDEFQDLTPAHVLLIRLLSSPGGAVFGVGDDDQTIYGYNGADPAWLIDFEKLFPGAGSHPLEVNYRCPPGIVDAVDRLLRHNTRRVAKTIRSGSAEPGPGWSVDRSPDPVAASLAAVRAALDAGASTGEIAVLTRVNAVLAPVQVALSVDGILVAGGVGPEFVERTAIRTVLAWLRLATAGTAGAGPRHFSTDDVREALRRPSRSFHPRINDWITEQTSIDELERLAERLNNDKDADKVRAFAGDIGALQGLARQGATTARIIRSLIDDIGLAGAVNTLDAHRRGMNRAAQSDDLTAIEQLADLHGDPTTFGSWLRDQLAIRRSVGGVVLATVHRVKGQEWPHVVVHLADAEQYPHRLAEDVEEERRLFHVAITRASRHASIVAGARPSPFIDELTTEPSQSDSVALHKPSVPAKTPGAKAAKTDPTAELDERGKALFDALSQLRHELRDGKPAYVVFDNKTGAAIAQMMPSNLVELGRVPGIGPAKLEKYGEAILAVVSEGRP